MSELLRKVGVMLPRFKPVATHIAKSKTPLNELRRQIWQARAEYWWRKISGYPQVVQAAKAEARAFLNAAKNPGEVTYRQVADVGVGALQVYACFVLGEMYGRQNIIGYDVGPHHEYHNYED